MIVVSNTSPITNLAAIGRLDLLRSEFSQIRIADAVWHELNAKGMQWPGAREVSDAPWITRSVSGKPDLVNALRRHLDRGEAETIALALECSAELVLLDEKDGRHSAQKLGLRVMGTVGVLIRAKQLELIADLRPELDALRQRAGFYLAEELYREVIKLSGEGNE